MLEQTNKHSSIPARKNQGGFLAFQINLTAEEEETVKRYTKLQNATKVSLFENEKSP